MLCMSTEATSGGEGEADDDCEAELPSVPESSSIMPVPGVDLRVQMQDLFFLWAS